MWLNEAKNYHGEAIGQGNFESWGHFSKLCGSFEPPLSQTDKDIQRNACGELVTNLAWVLRPTAREVSLWLVGTLQRVTSVVRSLIRWLDHFQINVVI